MTFTPVILWSDALVFLLLAAGAASAWYIRRREHLLLPWRRVGKSRVAMVSLVTLSLFLVIGLLDTLHFRMALPQSSNGQKVYAPEVLSVFDKLVEPLRTHTEKTYSAPFALTLYAKESMTDAQGDIVRDYPRLQYGGAHLADESQRAADVVKRGSIGALAGFGLGVLLLVPFVFFGRNNPSWPPLVRGGTDTGPDASSPPLTAAGSLRSNGEPTGVLLAGARGGREGLGVAVIR